ncbi:hypothetical protein JTE90_029258 [Oedothorax gibbosus]|uniref:Uncharacterized protein n=1 Tax=Oedothorax gibbosus TaxID=931172 RepID=A0AAV6TVV3_9ARAC|nr:hypothetical protein JTE90_029258 [Oedothorax gibbosus]
MSYCQAEEKNLDIYKELKESTPVQATHLSTTHVAGSMQQMVLHSMKNILSREIILRWDFEEEGCAYLVLKFQTISRRRFQTAASIANHGNGPTTESHQSADSRRPYYRTPPSALIFSAARTTRKCALQRPWSGSCTGAGFDQEGFPLGGLVISQSDTDMDLEMDMTASSVGKYALKPSALSKIMDYGRLGDTKLDNVIDDVVREINVLNDNDSSNIEMTKCTEVSEFASNDMLKNPMESNLTGNDLINAEIGHLNSNDSGAALGSGFSAGRISGINGNGLTGDDKILTNDKHGNSAAFNREEFNQCNKITEINSAINAKQIMHKMALAQAPHYANQDTANEMFDMLEQEIDQLNNELEYIGLCPIPNCPIHLNCQQDSTKSIKRPLTPNENADDSALGFTKPSKKHTSKSMILSSHNGISTNNKYSQLMQPTSHNVSVTPTTKTNVPSPKTPSKVEPKNKTFITHFLKMCNNLLPRPLPQNLQKWVQKILIPTMSL